MGPLLQGKISSKSELHTNGRFSTGDILMIFLHFSISIGMLLCLIVTAVVSFQADQDVYEHEYVRTAMKFLPFYFSLWGTTSQLVCFNLFTAADIISLIYSKDERLMKLKNKLEYIGSHMLFSHAFPMSLSIFAIFWGWYLIDRETIYPSILDSLLPVWSNHAMHTCPVPISLVLLLTTEKHVPEKKIALRSLLRTMYAYAVVFGTMKFIFGEWPYVGFNKLPYLVPYFVMFCVWLFTLSSLYIGYWLKTTFRNFMKNPVGQKLKVENIKED